MEQENLSTLNIAEFDSSNTIYIRNKEGFNKPTYLCQFVKWDEHKKTVTGKVLEIPERDWGKKVGDTLVNKLSQCALYGSAVENSGQSYYHWFDSIGYALHPLQIPSIFRACFVFKTFY